MIQSHRISVLAPLGLSVVALVCTMIIHLLPLRATSTLFGVKEVAVMSARPGPLSGFLLV
jgi:hypothetical protein